MLALLPFNGAGSATFYDLRHFTMQTAPKVRKTKKYINPIKAGGGGVWRPPCSFFALALSFVTLSP